METDKQEHQSSSEQLKNIPNWSVAIALLLAPLTSYLIVSGFVILITIISNEQWPLTIIWPPALYEGGIIGGFIGGLLTFWELRKAIDNNKPLLPGKLFPSDLFYLGMLVLLTYVLEFLSESLIIQGIFFLLEIAFFTVIGRNISKIMLRTTETKESQDSQPPNNGTQLDA
ncbi:MAG: hypothetical protein ACXAC8_19980 [Candidatus Hodarchaeales archaeon]|jgi:hypothetical protein